MRADQFASQTAGSTPTASGPGSARKASRSRGALWGAIVALAVTAFATLGASPASGSIQYDRQFAGSVLNGLFVLPSGVAVDPSGNDFVADTGDNRVQEFNSSGGFVRKWGAVGTADGQFLAGGPIGVAAGSSGNVYVVDTGNSRVQEFNSSGGFVRKWGAVGTNNGQFTAPQGIAVDSSGNVYVADTGNNRVQEFDSTGNFIRAWGGVGVGDGQFSLPSAVGVDSDGNVYVADTGNSRIQKFDSTGNFIRAWGSAGTGDGQFGPTVTPGLDLAVDSSDNVVVVDPTNNRVEKFRPVGTFITKWGTLGIGNGQFTTPAGVAISSSDSIHVVDRGVVNGRVEVFHETDTTDPDTSLDSGPSGVSSGDVSFAFSSAEPQLLTPGFECRLDTTEWAACGSSKAYSNLPEGSHTFRVRAVDAAGNPDPSPGVRTWTVDRTPAETALDSGPSGSINDPSPSFSFSSEPGASFQCRIDSSQASDWQGCSSPKSYSNLSDGSHTFDVRASDPVGNTDPSPVSRTFTVDTVAPQTAVDSGPSGPTNNASPSFSFSSSELGTFQCRIDSSQPSDWQGCTSPKSFGSLSDGSHTVQIRAIDLAGNIDLSLV
ncbi:MAG: Ig-like domain-containing protein, partial [Solirubrobacterales bacterium]